MDFFLYDTHSSINNPDEHVTCRMAEILQIRCKTQCGSVIDVQKII